MARASLPTCLAVELGAALVDTDAIAHELTGPQGGAMPALIEAFGPEIVDAHGALDRAAMRRRVFADAAAKARLEGILHPQIGALADARRAAESAYVILAVPLLIESGTYRERCQRIVVVDCPENPQARVMARSGLTSAEVEAIMAAQVSRSERLRAADDVVMNDHDLANSQPQVFRLHRKYLALAGNKLHAGC